MNDISLTSHLSDSERLILMERVYELFGNQASKYLGGDSTSIPVETAEELLHSLLYTLKVAQAEKGSPERELLTDDLNELLELGQRILQSKWIAANELWKQACLSAPHIPNAFFEDTLNGLKNFFEYYDFWYFAHQIPCAIDYPLCVPVPESLEGVLYVEKWLHNLLIENWFLRKFQQQAVVYLLTKTAADYWEYPLNMCEQALINAVGLSIIQRPIFSLKLTDKDCCDIAKVLFDDEDITTQLDRGIASVISQLNAASEVKDYVRTSVLNIVPRLEAMRLSGNVNGIFIV